MSQPPGAVAPLAAMEMTSEQACVAAYAAGTPPFGNRSARCAAAAIVRP